MMRKLTWLAAFLVPLAFALSSNAAAGQRVALIIGNGAYKTSPLRNPVNDAHDMAALLKKLGFEVIALTDADRRQMETAINKLGRKLRSGGTGLFFFAGHGVQVAGINYLIPVDAHIETEGDVKFEAVNANRVLSKMQDAGNPLNMVFLDACRNNPFARMFRSAQQGLAPMDAPKGSLVAFATAPGSTAADGTGRNGVFTKNLLKYMPQPGLEVGPMMRRVRASVEAETGDKQTPFELSSLTGSFYFNAGSGQPAASAVPPPSVTPPPQPPGSADSGIEDYEAIARKRKAAMAQWESWQNNMESEFGKAETLCSDPVFKPEEKADIWGRFLSAYGEDNPYSDRDEALRAKAESAQREWESRKGQMLAMGNRPGAGGGKAFTNSLGMKFVYIAPGTFTMGSPSGEPGRDDDETQHRVTLTRGYFLQATEVTQGQWKAVMGSNPSYFKNCGDDCPVEQVSWNDAQEFIQRLNQKEGGERYRLPTEAEWEYAARAGSDTAFANGGITELVCGHDPNLDAMGWYCGNANKTTHPVARKQPNAWGLYDMHGNVIEWCQDWYEKNYPSGSVTDPAGPSSVSDRVLRGGSWFNGARYCRSANRSLNKPGHRGHIIGFRLACRPGQ